MILTIGIVALWQIALAQEPVCSDVYPQLSCGIKYKDKDSCEAIGGCWDDANENSNKCYAPKIFGYYYEQVSEEPGVVSGRLTLNQESGLKFGKDYQELDITVTQETQSRTHIKIVPSGEERWEIPENIIPRPGGIYTESDAMMSTTIKPQPDDDPYDNMEIQIFRTADRTGRPLPRETIFIFTKMLVFQPQYVQFVLGGPPNVEHSYGFGESTRATQEMSFNTTYTLWNSDWPASMPDTATYGSHPFFMQVTADGKAHGVLFMNSNAMDATYTSSDSQGKTIGVQSTGGIVDLYIFAGPSPVEVLQQYLEVVGMPAMVPFWSLGFHNCEWGYPSVAYVNEVVANYSAAQIPLETQWMDIDYMDSYKDFTVDPVNFAPEDMQQFTSSLHANKQHFVPIIDPGIYAGDKEGYAALKEGLEQEVFVRDLTNNPQQPYLGQVWPGQVYFPDFFAANTAGWWEAQLKDFYGIAEYDGIWIDMNEVSNFCNVNGDSQVCLYSEDVNNMCDCSTVDPENSYDFAPFVPHVLVPELGGKTIAMSALHAGDVLEYDAHNLHGLMESIATRAALLNIRGERPFVLSRSTFLGSGKYTAHWTGDNAATWDDLRYSIITMNNLAIFGMPMTGADICGFNGDTTEELCARWIEVGAFSTFSRNHNAINQMPQELYRWDSVTTASVSALQMRYRLLPHLYTLMFRAATYGEPVHNAMWMQFPGGENNGAAFSQESQYMWSKGLLFTPVVTAGATEVTGYFPQGLWYQLFDTAATGQSAMIISTEKDGQLVTLNTPLTSTNAHVRGGTVVAMQDAGMTTAEVRASPYTLLVALDARGRSAGSLFIDDGVQESFAAGSYDEISYSAAAGTLTSTRVVESTANTETFVLGKIEIRGQRLGPHKTGSVPDCVGKLIDSSSGVTLLPSVVAEVSLLDDHYTLLDFSILDLQATDAVSTVPITTEFSFVWKCSFF